MHADRIELDLKRRTPHGENCIVVNGQPINARRILIEASADQLTRVLIEQVCEVSGTVQARVQRLMSTDRPKTPGWYWGSHPSRHEGAAVPCRVFEAGNGALFYSVGGDLDEIDGFEMDEADEDWRWAPFLETPPGRGG